MPAAVPSLPRITDHVVVAGSVNGKHANTFLDDGANSTYVNTSFAHNPRNNIETKRLDHPLVLGLADGSTSSYLITEYAEFSLQLGEHKEDIRCWVADIDYDITLGKSWHEDHEPTKLYRDGLVEFRDTRCIADCSGGQMVTVPMVRGALPGKPLPKAPVPVGIERVGGDDSIDIQEVGLQACAMMSRQQGAEVHLVYINPQESNQFKTPADPVTAMTLMAHGMTARRTKTSNEAFACAMYIDNSVAEAVDSSTFLLRASALSASDVEVFMNGKDKDQAPSKLPAEYSDWKEVFSRRAADELPPHRPNIDMEIKLKDDAQPPFKRPYPMSNAENDVVKKWIDEQLEKGNIQKSNSPAASPVIIVKKPGGGLRVCIDYRALNAITVKSRYPIPLMQDTLNRISGKKWFTKLDVIAAFNRVRIAQGHEWKTAFTTRYGQFECLVMPFGLCNAPGTFQSYVNDSVREFLDDFVSAYIDDLLIFSDTLEEHKVHVASVLEKMAKAGLQLDIDKCEFHVQETKYLGLIIGKDGIRMDPEKVRAIQEWQTPQKPNDILAFLGFAGFYRRFVKNFSRIVSPMVALTKTKNPPPWLWTEECQRAFEGLKKAFSEAPILAMFEPGLETVLETDASDFVTAAVLSQRGRDGILRPVAFLSKKMTPAECNYDIYDKELMAIVKAFEEWRPELSAAEHVEEFENLPGDQDKPILVLSDHKNLEYFMSTKQLNRRQARWAEFLSGFNFKITYRPGAQGTKPDSLTRRTQDLPAGSDDERVKHQERILLSPDRFLYTAANTVQELATEEPLATDPTADAAGAPQEEEEIPLNLAIQQLYASDEEVQKAVRQLEAGEPCPMLRRHKIRDATTAEGLIYVKNRYGKLCLYLPPSDDPTNKVRTRVIEACHDVPSAGHPGRAKTLDLLARSYHWPGISQSVRQYINNCRTCRRTKPSQDQYSGLLRPLPIPFNLWDDIAMDFVVDLPPSRSSLNHNEYRNILTVTDRLGKGKHLIEVDSMTAEHCALVFVNRVYKHHGLPLRITSDRGSQWVSAFWKRLCQLLQIEQAMSSAYHPETDGQAENTNKAMEQYLRAFVTYAQDDWVDWLALCEFALNNHVSESTGVSAFFADTARNPRTDFNTAIPLPLLPQRQRLDAEAADRFAGRMKQMQEWLRENMALSQATQADYADRHRNPAPQFRVGDLVFVSTKNWKTARPTKKLDDKWAGPYPVTAVLEGACRLELPPTIRVANTFHTSLLRPAANDPLPGQNPPPPPPVEVEREDGVVDKEYVVEEVIDSEWRTPRGRAPRGGKQKQLWYKIKWQGYGLDEATWQRAEEVTEHAAASVADFHHNYPTKSKPDVVIAPDGWIPNEFTRRATHAASNVVGGQPPLQALRTLSPETIDWQQPVVTGVGPSKPSFQGTSVPSSSGRSIAQRSCFNKGDFGQTIGCDKRQSDGSPDSEITSEQQRPAQDAGVGYSALSTYEAKTAHSSDACCVSPQHSGYASDSGVDMDSEDSGGEDLEMEDEDMENDKVFAHAMRVAQGCCDGTQPAKGGG